MFNAANIRYLYWFAYRQRNENSWPVRLCFNVFFDCSPAQELANKYIAMLEWMGIEVDRIDTREDWLRVSHGPVHQAHGFSNLLVNHIARLPQECTNGDPHRMLHKIMYWRETGVYWIVRGPDLVEHSREEQLVVTYLPFLNNLPTVFYHPHLGDDAGVKIDAQACDDRYKVGDLIDEGRDPDDVMRAILQSGDYTPVFGGDLRGLFAPGTGRPSTPEAQVVRWIQHLYAPSNGPLSYNDPTHLRCKLFCYGKNSHIDIPLNWRDNLSSKE